MVLGDDIGFVDFDGVEFDGLGVFARFRGGLGLEHGLAFLIGIAGPIIF